MAYELRLEARQLAKTGTRIYLTQLDAKKLQGSGNMVKYGDGGGDGVSTVYQLIITTAGAVWENPRW